MIDAAFKDGMSQENDARICALCTEYGISGGDLGPSGIKFAKAEVLHRIEKGELPSVVKLEGSGIIFEREEHPIWAFRKVKYYTLRTHTQRVGGSSGFSVRVMTGVYFHTGAFQSEPVQTQALSEEGTGDLIIATHNLYFESPTRTVRIPSKKIISIHPHSDGIEIMRDGANAKPEVFLVDDPLFAVDLISRLNQL